MLCVVFFFKQKTAYEMRISDWSSDVCSSDLCGQARLRLDQRRAQRHLGCIMSENAPDSLIPYDEIVQEALRAVVGRVLGEIERTGGDLPGSHHFYITFKTGAAGVSIPTRLRERFPDEMTIVLQNKFRSEEHTSELQSLMRISYA